MSSRYRTDPETGAKFAWGGVLGIRSFDDAREERESYERMLIRRADILAPRRTFAQQLALERSVYETTDEMIDRRMKEIPLRLRVSRPRRAPTRSRPPVEARGRYTSHSPSMLVAQVSFTYDDSVMGRQSVKAGITHVAPKSAVALRFPSKFAA
jgi:hypothetical protein